MPLRACTIFVFVTFVILVPSLALCEEVKPSAANSALEACDRLYQSGKFAEAETGYQALLKADSNLVPAQVGLVLSMLKQQKIDQALEVVNSALAAQPNTAALLAVKGDVQFRRAEMSEAETSYLLAKRLDPKQARAYVGLARLYRAYSLYRKAYDLIQQAHEIAPNDIEVTRAWMQTLPRKERLAALKSYLAGPHPDDEEETAAMREYLEFLQATADKPVHACKLVSKVERTATKLNSIHDDPRRVHAVGLSVKLNGRDSDLLFDTGAGGITVGRKVAEKAGLAKISSEHYGGIGDKGSQSGYTAVADHIQIGELEFEDCIVSVSDHRSLIGGDGLIGADVFRAYLVDIDLPDAKLKLSPLPKRPEDTVAPTSLNSEGAQQANAEQEESGAVHATVDQQTPKPEPNPARHLPEDRYVAPEMANWTKVFRFAHGLLVPTMVNASKPMLFELDTGAFANTLSLRAAEQVGKVDREDIIRVRGLSGEVDKVYSSRKANLRFGHLQQDNMQMITLDLSSISRHMGTELSGFLGFSMLRMLDIKLDYRDGLVDFDYDPKKNPSF